MGDVVPDNEDLLSTSTSRRPANPYYNFNARLLHVLNAIVREGGTHGANQVLYGRGGDETHIALARLEELVGEKLVHRRHGLAKRQDELLTEAGRVVVEYSRRAETLFAELNRTIAALRRSEGLRLCVSMNESIAPYLLTHIARYKNLYPGVAVEMRLGRSSRIPNEIINGELELGFVGYPTKDHRLINKLVFSDYLVLVVAPGHEFARRELTTGGNQVMSSELVGHELIMHSGGSVYQEGVLNRLAEMGRRLKVGLTAPSMDMALQMVAAGLGVMLVPKQVALPYIEVGRVIPVYLADVQVERKVYMVRSQPRALGRASKAFFSLFE